MCVVCMYIAFVGYNHVSADNCTHLLGTNDLCWGCRLSLLSPDIFDIGYNVYILVLKHA